VAKGVNQEAVAGKKHGRKGDGHFLNMKSHEQGDMNMPWIDKDMCTGCGMCVEACPVDAIVLENELAEIHMSDCIRCGTCHDICDQEAVRHDGEKVPDEVRANVEETKYFMEACEKYLGRAEERQKCLNRMIKYFTKEKLVAEKTLEELELLRNVTVENQ
jgi:ferredoxin